MRAVFGEGGGEVRYGELRGAVHTAVLYFSVIWVVKYIFYSS